MGRPPRKPSGPLGLRAILSETLFSQEGNKKQQGLVRRNSPGWVVGKMREKVDSEPLLAHAYRCKAPIPSSFLLSIQEGQGIKNIMRFRMHSSIVLEKQNIYLLSIPRGSLPILNHSLHIYRLPHDHLALHNLTCFRCLT